MGALCLCQEPAVFGNGLIGLGWALAGNTHVGVVFSSSFFPYSTFC
jgi:hypothetical protein